MNLDVAFRNLQPRPEVRKRGQALYDKLARFLDPAAEGKLVVGIEGHHNAVVELVVTTHGHTFKVEENDEELRAALDTAFHTMEIQLRRHKERRIDRNRIRVDEEDGFGGPQATDEEMEGTS